MKTIIDTLNCSKYLFADDKPVAMKADQIEVGDPENLDFIIGDLHSGNATLVEGVTPPPADWVGCKYDYADGVWTPNPRYANPK